MGKHIKFELPVGAILGGLRHLGGGVFHGDLMPEPGILPNKAPCVIEGVTISSDGWSSTPECELIDDPTAGVACYRQIAMIGPQRDGVIIPGDEWPGALGIESDEYSRRSAAWCAANGAK